jgi:peptide-methionine (S)-S-oxide reductase
MFKASIVGIVLIWTLKTFLFLLLYRSYNFRALLKIFSKKTTGFFKGILLFQFMKDENEERAIFAAGCFWYVEKIFAKTKGVIRTRVGYTGGKLKNPTYEQVSSDKTGHAEAIEILFNPKKLSYKELLEIFWNVHDPTSLNRQGLDMGTNYRSAIFYLNEKQKQIALNSKKENNKDFGGLIVTEITKAREFYPAEEFHQKYFEKHAHVLCKLN